MFNKENFQLVLNQIKNNPDTWNQEVWHSICGTTHCFAGWAQILSGHWEAGDWAAGEVREPASKKAAYCARIFLGLSKIQAYYLFSPFRKMEDFEYFLNVDSSVYDHNGYDRYGYDSNGYDRYGYDRYGYDSNGRYRDGLLGEIAETD